MQDIKTHQPIDLVIFYNNVGVEKESVGKGMLVVVNFIKTSRFTLFKEVDF